MVKKKQAAGPKIRIDHKVFGLGTVVEADDHHTMIDFDESGTRKFVTSMVKYEPSDAPPPEKPRRKKATKKKAKKAAKKTAKKTAKKAAKKAK